MTSILKKIEYNNLYMDVIQCLLDQIYELRICGYKYSFIEVFSYNNNVIMSKIISDNSDNIQIILVELDFLKIINTKFITNNLVTQCSECGEMHAQHSYRTCGHNVNYFCAYNSLNELNSCNICKKQIKPVSIKLKTSKKKDICPICLENCNKKIETCGHYYHQKCINLHMKKSNECPMCRGQLYKPFFKLEKFKNTKFSLGANKEGIADIFIKTYI